MQLKNGSLLQGGKYKIVRFIASGGFGCTYEAHHTLLDSRVALKEFFVSDFCNRDERTGNVTVGTQSKVALYGKLKNKFMDEARSLFKMKHPGIVRVIDVFEENGTAYYAMEYIDGPSLSDVVKKRGKLPEAEAVEYIRQVADALKYVHSLNRLHLDIKPGNIMLNKEGKAVLIDFGASKHYDDETGENTSTLLGINTKGYAPVEQVNQSFKSFSPATDIYALGATLYKLLTGITPPPSTLLHSEEATLASLPSSINPSTRQAVEAAMQLLRKKRPQTVEEWEAILIEDEETNVDIVEIEPNPRPQKGIIIGMIVIILIAIGIIIPQRFSGNITYNESDADSTEVNGITGDKRKAVIIPNYSHALGNCVYKGTVDVNHQPDGNGVATWESGDAKEYDGQWVHGMMEGEATYTLSNGDVFKGTFKSDKYDKGRYTIYSTGEYYEGTFKEGNPSVGVWYNKEGKLIQ